MRNIIKDLDLKSKNMMELSIFLFIILVLIFNYRIIIFDYSVNCVINIIIFHLFIRNLKLSKKITNKILKIFSILLNVFGMVLTIYFTVIFYIDFKGLHIYESYSIPDTNDREWLSVVTFTDGELPELFSEVRYERELSYGFTCYTTIDSRSHMDDNKPYPWDLEEMYNKLSKIKNKGFCYSKVSYENEQNYKYE